MLVATLGLRQLWAFRPTSQPLTLSVAYSSLSQDCEVASSRASKARNKFGSIQEASSCLTGPWFRPTPLVRPRECVSGEFSGRETHRKFGLWKCQGCMFMYGAHYPGPWVQGSGLEGSLGNIRSWGRDSAYGQGQPQDWEDLAWQSSTRRQGSEERSSAPAEMTQGSLPRPAS